jgi:hypothetical protein
MPMLLGCLIRQVVSMFYLLNNNNNNNYEYVRSLLEVNFHQLLKVPKGVNFQ